MVSFHQLTTPFKLFWLVAVFGSLNTLQVAADDHEPDIWMGGLPDVIIHNQIYNISWGGRSNVTTISLYLSQLPGPKSSTLEQYRLAENSTDNPFKWNVTLPVDTAWALKVFSSGLANVSMGIPDLRVVSKASAAGKVIATSLSTLAFLVLAFAALAHF